ncbi:MULTISPECIES: hypothetical protein [Halobacillus]|uniref:hypothetical protein n=1 Tax=Halobacillus TaxID=45667 RepID=UPI0013719268|nr:MULTISPECIES: hypothetical protein [Halobacillus]MCA1022704.1 hypothetical protein [Halobacillus litoralis]MYL28601.1 hypothetical protein [Halobacillus halophilus]MYL37968.1 hypothetical protein [Halobacillus litoralis]
MHQKHKQESGSREGKEQEELDVLDLPPRQAVHTNRMGRVKWKVSTAWIRFWFIVFIVLICFVLSYPFWGEWFEGISFQPLELNEKAPNHEEITVER